MNKLSYVKKAILTAACISLCVVLPMAFHAIPNAGNIYCPMHMPVLLCGLVCGWPFGLLCGVAGPLLSSLFTGMPPAAYLPSMIIELAAYGLTAGLVMRFVHTRKMMADLYISLTAALLAGRIVAGASRALTFASGSYSMEAWITGYFVTALPGLLIQLALLPAVAFALEKARLIPVRYPRTAG